MRIGIKFRAQYEGDAQVVLRYVSKQLKVTDPSDLAVVFHEGSWWLLTSKQQFSSLDTSNTHIAEARAALASHVRDECWDYVQPEEGKKFVPALEFAIKVGSQLDVLCDAVSETTQSVARSLRQMAGGDKEQIARSLSDL